MQPPSEDVPPPSPPAPSPPSSLEEFLDKVSKAQLPALTVDPGKSNLDTPPTQLGTGAPTNEKQDKIVVETAADMAANRLLRDQYAGKAYNLASGCICMWTVLLGAQGVVKAIAGTEMWSEKVIIAVTTGVTVSVLAAFLGVIRGLFPNSEKKK